MGHNETSPKAIERAERRARAIRLRRQGKTLREIAKHLGISPAQAHSDIERAIQEIPADEVGTLRQLEAERLDDLQGSLWGAALGGDLAAVDRVLKVIAQRRALFGLDAPQRMEISGGDVDLDATVAKLLKVAEIAVQGGGSDAVDA